MVKKRELGYSSEDEKKKKEAVVVNEYEHMRAVRIKKNREKMRQLGIMTNPAAGPARLTRLIKKEVQAKSSSPSSPLPIKKKSPPPVVASRTSSRVMMMKKKEREKSSGREKGSSLSLSSSSSSEEDHDHGEVYSSEHEKALGDFKTPWPMKTKLGKGRLYDSVEGITCHQCRQKTLGPRTQCNLCNQSHGRLCGDCLYIRYGENLFEAKKNDRWSCPVCRGICNCSRYRERKGWPPTGSIHNQAWNHGFKSVAHYLIQTHRAKKKSI